MGTEITGINNNMMKLVNHLIFFVYIQYATTYILKNRNIKNRCTFGLKNIWCLEDPYNNKSSPFFKPYITTNKFQIDSKITRWTQWNICLPHALTLMDSDYIVLVNIWCTPLSWMMLLLVYEWLNHKLIT